MMKRLLIFPLIMFALCVQVQAQNVSNKTASCQEFEIADDSRRSYDALLPTEIDLDGDNVPDTITPRTYKVKANRKSKQSPKEVHWISFDLKTSGGKIIPSFFKYQYGAEDASYWSYALIPCRANNDGKTDLVFYSGDDTTDETIVLVNKGNKFTVASRKVKEY